MTRILILALCSLLIGACSDRVDIRSARIVRVSDHELELRVTISTADLRDIANLQIYPHVYLFGCANGFDFPMDPSLNGVPIHEFDRTRGSLSGKSGDEPVEVTGRVPARIVSQMDDPCVRLEGGSYLGTILRSTVVRVERS